MSVKVESLAIDKKSYQEKIEQYASPLIRNTQKIVIKYILFHLASLFIGGMEVALFLSFFAILGKSAILAFLLAIFLLSVFSFFVLRLYFQAKKPEQLLFFCENYLQQCQKTIGYQEGLPEKHLLLASFAQKLAKELHEKEYFFYSPPELLKSLSTTLEKFSAFCHWKDLHAMREFLLSFAVDEHIKAVKCEPTNLEIHAALANAYVMLSSLYADPRKYEGHDEEKYIPEERLSQEMLKKFKETAERAIEEFKILNDYAPNDPWVHIQLAYSYHDLQMPEEETLEYETVLKLRPDDKETLFKLGMLYFQLGKNAKGLRIYETLKRTHYQKADHLIKFYGSFVAKVE